MKKNILKTFLIAAPLLGAMTVIPLITSCANAEPEVRKLYKETGADFCNYVESDDFYNECVGNNTAHKDYSGVVPTDTKMCDEVSASLTAANLMYLMCFDLINDNFGGETKTSSGGSAFSLISIKNSDNTFEVKEYWTEAGETPSDPIAHREFLTPTPIKIKIKSIGWDANLSYLQLVLGTTTGNADLVKISIYDNGASTRETRSEFTYNIPMYIIQQMFPGYSWPPIPPPPA